ncbi:hypothetical protein [Candidatus Phytoplasma oryzae]|nr:hypothetical protein PIE28_01100 [Candidatus Phytoplasma oryzae]
MKFKLKKKKNIIFYLIFLLIFIFIYFLFFFKKKHFYISEQKSSLDFQKELIKSEIFNSNTNEIKIKEDKNIQKSNNLQMELPSWSEKRVFKKIKRGYENLLLIQQYILNEFANNPQLKLQEIQKYKIFENVIKYLAFCLYNLEYLVEPYNIKSNRLKKIKEIKYNINLLSDGQNKFQIETVHSIEEILTKVVALSLEYKLNIKKVVLDNNNKEDNKFFLSIENNN